MRTCLERSRPSVGTTATRAARTVAVAGLGALAAAILVMKVGVAGLAVPLGLLVLLVPLSNPRLAVGLLVGCAILVESSTANVLHITTDQFHDPIPGHYGPLELLMALAIGAVVIDAARRRRVPLRPAPFGPAIAVLALALLVGSVVGHYAGQGFNPITEQLRPVLPLIVVPWLTVNVIRDMADLRRAIGLIAILTAAKAALGLIGLVTHVGAAANGSTITYYEATANWLALTFLMVVLASTVSRLPVERIARWAVPLVLLSLALSLRRSFWIGTVAAAPLVLVIAAAPIGRRFLLPATAVLAAALWITISSGVVTDTTTPIGQRIQSLSPSRLVANPEDRYRLDERKNVLAKISASPFVGVGLAVPWQEQFPLSVENPGGRLYVHMAVLWFWLKLGVLGLIAYLGYMLTAIVVGVQVFRRHRDTRIRVAAAGAAAGLAGLMVVETTATFLGTDLRMTVVVGCIVGLLSVALRQTRSPTESSATQEPPPTNARLRAPHPATRALPHDRQELWLRP